MSNVQRISWTRIAAESLAIVVSILLAFGIEAWWSGHQERLDERALLEELRTTLGEDIESVSQEADTISLVRDRLRDLVSMLESGQDMSSRDPAYQEAFYGLHRFIVINVRYAPYETLKGRGLHLISNAEIRLQLTALYEDLLPQLVGNSEIDQRLSRDRVLPFMLDYLRLGPTGHWVANRQIEEATELGLTLARYRLDTLEQFFVPSFGRTLDLMGETLDAIDHELGLK